MSGSAFKDALAIAIALSKENKKVSGKINLGKMLRQTRDIRTFSMSPEQYERFRKQAKKQKILFSTVKDRDKKGAVVDVILPATEVERANQIFERIHYDPKKGPENPPPEAEKPKHWWQKVFRGRGKSKEKESEAKAETAVKQDSPAKSGENQNPTTPDAEEKPGPETKTEPETGSKTVEGIPIPTPEREANVAPEPIPTAAERSGTEAPINPETSRETAERIVPEMSEKIIPEAEPIILPAEETSRQSSERAGQTVIPIPIRAITLEPAEKPGKDSAKPRPERDGPPREPRENGGESREKSSPKENDPSKADSQDTNDRSKPAPDRMSINRKPSILKRLETYRKEQADAPSREQRQNKGRSKGGGRLADKSGAPTASGNGKGGKRLAKVSQKVR